MSDEYTVTKEEIDELNRRRGPTWKDRLSKAREGYQQLREKNEAARQVREQREMQRMRSEREFLREKAATMQQKVALAKQRREYQRATAPEPQRNGGMRQPMGQSVFGGQSIFGMTGSVRGYNQAPSRKQQTYNPLGTSFKVNQAPRKKKKKVKYQYVRVRI